MTFWERVKTALSENNLTEADLSRELNLTQASNGTAKLKLDKTTMGLSDFYNNCDKLAESLNQYYLDF